MSKELGALNYLVNLAVVGNKEKHRGKIFESEEIVLQALKRNKQLTNLEKELDIDLITLFKAYTNGFYVKGENDKQYIDFENSLNAIAFKNGEMFYGHKWSYQYVNLKDYGKTWALTEEELE